MPGKETAMGKFTISGETRKKLEYALDFVADVVFPVIVVGGSSYILGHLMGQREGYKHGVDVGMVYGSSVAYSHVVDTLKVLKS